MGWIFWGDSSHALLYLSLKGRGNFLKRLAKSNRCGSGFNTPPSKKNPSSHALHVHGFLIDPIIGTVTLASLKLSVYSHLSLPSYNNSTAYIRFHKSVS